MSLKSKQIVESVVVVNSSIFRDIMLCSFLKVNLCFREICTFHHLGQRIHQAKNRMKAGDMKTVPLKHWLHFNGLHDVISQKTEIFSKHNVSIYTNICLHTEPRNTIYCISREPCVHLLPHKSKKELQNTDRSIFLGHFH
jgi:hypothetical protein